MDQHILENGSTIKQATPKNKPFTYTRPTLTNIINRSSHSQYLKKNLNLIINTQRH